MDVNYMGLIWIGCIIAFAILEMYTVQLVSIWFVIGAVAGLVAYLIGASVTVQIAAAIIVSALSLILLRKFVYGILKPKDTKTNVASLIGKELIVDEEINNILNSGSGKLNGITWKLKSSDDEIIKKGEKVKVNEIKGVTLWVSKVKSGAPVNM